MTVYVLQDPQSGESVKIALLELEQQCQFCGVQMRGTWGVSTGGSSWSCLDHGTRLMMALKMTPAMKDRAFARDQLKRAQPGDVIVVSRSILSALGLEP